MPYYHVHCVDDTSGGGSGCGNKSLPIAWAWHPMLGVFSGSTAKTFSVFLITNFMSVPFWNICESSNMFL